eukprot:CAMPEP_0180381176 /NCGR_PEP_ID=MMETSP0989-20121125/26507_1 /TAXON_ID=697907 /ORGANISM="non described non described, Strain CCMP2293" /LENGTH=241 /DNA_ID=CAMNT_0022380837 /DNA_START=52 /DNA_END=774 /DNA_ORIENTATION=+
MTDRSSQRRSFNHRPPAAYSVNVQQEQAVQSLIEEAELPALLQESGGNTAGFVGGNPGGAFDWLDAQAAGGEAQMDGLDIAASGGGVGMMRRVDMPLFADTHAFRKSGNTHAFRDPAPSRPDAPAVRVTASATLLPTHAPPAPASDEPVHGIIGLPLSSSPRAPASQGGTWHEGLVSKRGEVMLKLQEANRQFDIVKTVPSGGKGVDEATLLVARVLRQVEGDQRIGGDLTPRGGGGGGGA